MNFSHLGARIYGRYQRATAGALFSRTIPVSPEVPLISFTFDDFPQSALLQGGAILRHFGLRGTYFAAFGLMGTTGATGSIFRPQDLTVLLDQEHELGCHTFAHCDSWETKPTDLEQSVVDNRVALQSSLPGAAFRTFSYPISPPRAQTKRRMGRHFDCCRGGGQKINVGSADLNYLSAYFIEQARGNIRAMKDLIDQNQHSKGWLIFATHDVCSTRHSLGAHPIFLRGLCDMPPPGRTDPSSRRGFGHSPYDPPGSRPTEIALATVLAVPVQIRLARLRSLEIATQRYWTVRPSGG